MSREIKFRVWEEREKAYNTWDCVLDTLGNLFRNVYGALIGCNEKDYIVEQDTGLKDRNGKEIYEGDIVEIGKYGKYQVIWNEWACKFDFDKIGKREREEPLLSQDWEQEAEVIGNIHKNPELLGGKE